MIEIEPRPLEVPAELRVGGLLSVHSLQHIHGRRRVTERGVQPPQQQASLWPAGPRTPRHQRVGQRVVVLEQGHALLRTLEARLRRVGLIDGVVEQLSRLGMVSRCLVSSGRGYT